MTEDQYNDSADVSQPDERIAELEDRIQQLEATTKKMMPTRRDALKYGGAAAIGAAAMSGTASAGSSQVGTIGDSNNLVDVEAEDIEVSDTLNGASVSGAAAGEALTSDGAGGLTFASAGGGVPPNFSYVDKTASRSVNTVFTNSTGKALYVKCGLINSGSAYDELFAKVVVGGVDIHKFAVEVSSTNLFDFFSNIIPFSFFVPDNVTYEVVESSGTLFVDDWYEAEM